MTDAPEFRHAVIAWWKRPNRTVKPVTAIEPAPEQWPDCVSITLTSGLTCIVLRTAIYSKDNPNTPYFATRSDAPDLREDRT